MLRWLASCTLLLCGAAALCAPEGTDPAGAAGRLAKMPVKEITVFKDGHAFVLHAGRMPVDAKGDVRLDYLPVPVLGTYWPYSADRNVRLRGVTASPRTVRVEKTALDLAQLLEANPGAAVLVRETNGRRYPAQVVGVPKRSEEKPAARLGSTEPPEASYPYPPGVENAPGSETVLLKTPEGVQALPLRRVEVVTFRGDFRRAVPVQEARNQLTLHLEWPAGAAPPRDANVGMVYLQKGVRWIPNYRVSIDGHGNAVVKLQATLLNQLVDLEKVTANLVIGVPSFLFKETPDPISLQEAFPELSRFFHPDSATGYAFSNAVMSQGGFGVGGFGGGGLGGGFGGRAARWRAERASAPENEVESEQNEDLYVFTLKGISLKKGESAVLPVAEYPMKYRDVYTLNVPLAPPKELQQNLTPEQALEMARLLRTPRAEHRIRLTNLGPHPLTTAPALVVNGDRVLAQSLMTYAPAGTDTDLKLTTAGNIQAKRSDTETQRTPNALIWQKETYGKSDLAGALSVENRGREPVDLEATRWVPGLVDHVDQGGIAERVSLLDGDDTEALPPGARGSWSGWWSALNGIARISWKVRLEPGKSTELRYAWHYFWR